MQHGTSVVPCCAAPRGPSRHRPSHQWSIIPWHFTQRLRSRHLPDPRNASVVRQRSVIHHPERNAVRRYRGSRLCACELFRLWRLNRTYTWCAGPPVLWVWVRLSRVLVVSTSTIESLRHIKTPIPLSGSALLLPAYRLVPALPQP